MSATQRAGLFVGLLTLDVIYRVGEPVGANQKVRAEKYVAAAGGPATNAAVAFNALGSPATLLTCAGNGHLSPLVTTELHELGIGVTDATESGYDVPIASCIVQAEGGDRAVVSFNDGSLVADPARVDVATLVAQAGAVMVDGHYMPLALACVDEAARQGKPVVLDGGSWKPGTEELLARVDYAICSEAFAPPGVEKTPDAVLDFVLAAGARNAAVSRGGDSIIWRTSEGGGELAVPPVNAVDTLGAGDVLHGAFTWFLLHNETSDETFADRLSQAGQVASYSCRYFGTREWIDNLR